MAFCFQSVLNAMSSCYSVLDVFRIIPLVKALHSVVFLSACQLPRLNVKLKIEITTYGLFNKLNIKASDVLIISWLHCAQ